MFGSLMDVNVGVRKLSQLNCLPHTVYCMCYDVSQPNDPNSLILFAVVDDGAVVALIKPGESSSARFLFGFLDTAAVP